jgi:hypothetical protein
MLVCRCPDVSVNPKDDFSQHGEHGKSLDFRSSEESVQGVAHLPLGLSSDAAAGFNWPLGNSTAVAHQSARLACTYRQRGVPLNTPLKW